MNPRFLGAFPRLLVVSALMVTVAGCTANQPASPSAGGSQTFSTAQAMSNVTVSMQNLRFNPRTVTVTMGTTVVWTNNDPQGIPHTTTSDTGLWDSGRMSVGQSYSHKFNQPGTYRYHCTLHQGEGMVGTIIVQ